MKEPTENELKNKEKRTNLYESSRLVETTRSESDQEKIEKAKSQIAEAEKIYLDAAYFDRIKEMYVTSDKYVRNSIEKGLEELIANPSSFGGFNGEIAKKLRIKAGYKSQRGLAAFLKVGQQSISKFENGIAPRHYSTKRSQKYFHWLKEQGYNPYDL